MARLARLEQAIPGAHDARRIPAIETPRLVLRSNSSEPAGTVALAILIKPGLTEGGWIEFSLRDGGGRVAQMCFFLAPPYRGTGLMREALRAAAPRALRFLDARTIQAMLPADANSAHAVVRSIGLVQTWRRGAVTRFEKELCLLF